MIRSKDGTKKKGFTGVELIVLVAISGLVMFFAGPNIGKSFNNIFHGGQNKTKITSKVTESYPMFYKDKDGNFIPSKVPYMKTAENFNYVTENPPETLWEKFWHLGAMAVLIVVVLSYLGLWPIIALWWNKKIKPKIEQTEAQLEDMTEQKDVLRGDAKLIVISVDEGLAAINTSIASAQSTYDASKMALNAANSLVDSSTDQAFKRASIANAQITLSTSEAVLDAVTDLKKEFLAAMSRKQDTTTKLLVSTLKND